MINQVERNEAMQVLAHGAQISQIYIEELQTAVEHHFPQKSTNELCIKIKKLGAHLGVAKLQNLAIHLQFALKNKELQQTEKHAQNLKMSIIRLSQELKQAGKDYVCFFNS